MEGKKENPICLMELFHAVFYTWRKKGKKKEDNIDFLKLNLKVFSLIFSFSFWKIICHLFVWYPLKGMVRKDTGIFLLLKFHHYHFSETYYVNKTTFAILLNWRNHPLASHKLDIERI